MKPAPGLRLAQPPRQPPSSHLPLLGNLGRHVAAALPKGRGRDERGADPCGVWCEGVELPTATAHSVNVGAPCYPKVSGQGPTASACGTSARMGRPFVAYDEYDRPVATTSGASSSEAERAANDWLNKALVSSAGFPARSSICAISRGRSFSSAPARAGQAGRQARWSLCLSCLNSCPNCCRLAERCCRLR